MDNINEISKANKKRTVVIILFLIILCTSVMTIVGEQRERLHIDEVWTYGLSNSNGAPFFYDWNYGLGDSFLQSKEDFDYHNEQEYKEYFYHWHTSDYYRDYLTVQENERFDYGNVYSNQEKDTHPPLYYFVIHTVCSLFPDSFSIEYGLVPNLVFYAFSLLFLFLIARELLKSEWLAILAMLLWGLSRAGITEVLFIRMYMMESMLVLCLIYANIKLLKNFRWSIVFLIAVIDIAGFLTHYYFYIAAFYITFFTCIHFLLKKQWKKMFGYGFAGLAAVGAAILIFPATIRHLTKGTWSGTTSNNLGINFTLLDDIKVLLNQIVSFYSGIDINLGIVVNIAVIFFICYPLIKSIKKNHFDKGLGFSDDVLLEEYVAQGKKAIKSVAYLIYTKFIEKETVTLAVFAAGLTIVKLEPEMGDYTIRYLFAVLPLFSIYIVLLLKTVVIHIWNKQDCKKAIFTVVASVIVLVLCSNLLQPQVLLKLNQDSIGVSLQGEKAIVANVESYRDHSFAYFYLDADKVYPIDEIDSRLANVITELDKGETVLFIVHDELASKKRMDSFLSEIKGITFSYLTKTKYPLEIDSYYYVYELVRK